LTYRSPRAAWLLCTALAAAASSDAFAQPAPSPAPRQERKEGEDQISPADAINKARRYFDYGDYPAVSRILTRLDVTGIESPELRIDAYRLLGLSLFYQGKRGEAYRAFLELLYLDPDFQMDPFYVPPAAAEAFNEVRRDAEAQLAPIRAQKRSEQEAKRRALEEEAARRRQRELEDEQRRLTALAPVIERRVVTREFWVTMLPFGVGQLQNGDRGLGIALATGQVVAGATSAGSALLIEGLRDSGTGKFGEGNYMLARRLNVAKWVGAGIFFALWMGGAIHAAVHFQPESTPIDRLVTTGNAASAPPSPLPDPALPNGATLRKPPAPPAATPGTQPPAPPAPEPAPR
jgi:tetratricopeptide (TPR) repeat protein